MIPSDFQITIDSKQTDLFFIGNEDIEVSLCNYGARLVSLNVRDKKGEFQNILFSFESLEEFLKADNPYYGATIGRYANRIAAGKFSLNNKEYFLPLNNGLNHLHGGHHGLHQLIWDAHPIDTSSIKFICHSQDGDEGYPSDLDVEVIFSVRFNELHINYSAFAKNKTIINLTNHAFFNLNGKSAGDILSHEIKINADSFTPIDENLIPTGEIRAVDKSPFDFRAGKIIGESIDDDNPQLNFAGGFDHNFVLNQQDNSIHYAASAIGDQSGIVLEILTSEPGLQFYSGNFMQEPFYRHAFALEPQHYPDSPNHPQFPSTELMGRYNSTTIYRFSVKNDK